MSSREGLLLNMKVDFLVVALLRSDSSCTATKKLISCSIFPEAFVHLAKLMLDFPPGKN